MALAGAGSENVGEAEVGPAGRKCFVTEPE